MFVRIKKTINSARALYDANVPLEVVDRILGEVVELNSNHEYMTKLAGISTCWNIPTDCFEPVRQSKEANKE